MLRLGGSSELCMNGSAVGEPMRCYVPDMSLQTCAPLGDLSATSRRHLGDLRPVRLDPGPQCVKFSVYKHSEHFGQELKEHTTSMTHRLSRIHRTLHTNLELLQGCSTSFGPPQTLIKTVHSTGDLLQPRQTNIGAVPRARIPMVENACDNP